MATHERPDDENRPLNTYICSPKQLTLANRCIEFLDDFPILKVWEVQYPKPKDYTCWYVSFRHNEKPWILNFTIYSSYTNIEFRYPQYIPNDILDRLKWQTTNWKYVKFASEKDKERLKGIMKVYLNNIRTDFDMHKLRQGGKSFAEGFIANLLSNAFPVNHIKRNVRPEWLKSDKGRYLELDIFVPEKKLAMEIQGPQHFTDLYSDKRQHLTLKKNDLLKKNSCRKKGLRLIWMNVDGINKDLMRRSRKERTEIVRGLVSNFINSDYRFLWWKNVDELVFE